MVNPIGVNNAVDIQVSNQNNQVNSLRQRLEKKIGKTALTIISVAATAVVGVAVFALIKWTIIPAAALYGISMHKIAAIVAAILFLLAASIWGRDPNEPMPGISLIPNPSPYHSNRIIPR